jgi:hypothetical protein
MELELATKQELIEELLSRETFSGILIASNGDFKGKDLSNFDVAYRNIQVPQMKKIVYLLKKWYQKSNCPLNNYLIDNIELVDEAFRDQKFLDEFN